MLTKVLSAMAIAAVATIVLENPCQAQNINSDIGIGVTFSGGNILYGVESKFELSPQQSIRPGISFGTVNNTGVTVWHVHTTQDFQLGGGNPFQRNNTATTIYVGTGFTGGNYRNGVVADRGASVTWVVGADVDFSENFSIKAAGYFGDGEQFSAGIGYRF
jgi:hypothetical protein